MSELMFFEIPEKEGFSFGMRNPGPARKICTVRDGDIFDLGDKKLKVLEVPSHTLGCIALFEEKKGWLFTGDIMLTYIFSFSNFGSQVSSMPSLRNSDISTEDSITEVCAWQPRRDRYLFQCKACVLHGLFAALTESAISVSSV